MTLRGKMMDPSRDSGTSIASPAMACSCGLLLQKFLTNLHQRQMDAFSQRSMEKDRRVGKAWLLAKDGEKAYWIRQALKDKVSTLDTRHHTSKVQAQADY